MGIDQPYRFLEKVNQLSHKSSEIFTQLGHKIYETAPLIIFENEINHHLSRFHFKCFLRII